MLSAQLMSHFTKRNADAIRHYDPATLDHGVVTGRFERYGTDAVRQ